jgi:hypothetical protein
MPTVYPNKKTSSSRVYPTKKTSSTKVYPNKKTSSKVSKKKRLSDDIINPIEDLTIRQIQDMLSGSLSEAEIFLNSEIFDDWVEQAQKTPTSDIEHMLKQILSPNVIAAMKPYGLELNIQNIVANLKKNNPIDLDNIKQLALEGLLKLKPIILAEELKAIKEKLKESTEKLNKFENRGGDGPGYRLPLAVGGTPTPPSSHNGDGIPKMVGVALIAIGAGVSTVVLPAGIALIVVGALILFFDAIIARGGKKRRTKKSRKSKKHKKLVPAA